MIDDLVDVFVVDVVVDDANAGDENAFAVVVEISDVVVVVVEAGKEVVVDVVVVVADDGSVGAEVDGVGSRSIDDVFNASLCAMSQS